MKAPALLLCSVAVAALAAAGAPAPASACGAFFPSVSATNAAIDAQRALFVWREKTVDMHLQLVADTDGGDFVWILPVPDQPTLALGDAAVFDALDAIATPTVEIARDSGGGGGGFCGSDAAGGALGQPRGGVQHFGGGTLGDYTWDLIAGQEAEAVAAWLETNAYAVPEGFAAVAAAYTSMRFLAVRLSPDRADDGLDLTPLIVTVERPATGRLVFPLGFSRVSAPETTPLVFYNLADKRHRVANAASVEVATVGAELRALVDESLDAGYDDAVDALTADAGGRLVVTEFAGAVDVADLLGLAADEAPYLTRLYARVRAEHLDDLVITFANHAGDVDNHVIAASDSDLGDGPTSFALAFFGLLVARRFGPR